MSRLLSKNKGRLFKPTYRKHKKDMRAYLTPGKEDHYNLSAMDNTNFESTASFRYEKNLPIKSTQQLNIDYSFFENHTFFHSAVAKTNEAFLKIINEYPYAGSLKKIESFEDELTGFEKYIFDTMPKNVGYLIFSGTQKGEASTNGTQINVSDEDGTSISSLSSGITKNETLDPLNNNFSLQFFIKPEAQTNDNQIIVQKKSSLANNLTIFLSESNDSSKCNLNFGITSGSYFNFVSASIDKGSFSYVTALYNKLKLELTIYDSNNIESYTTSSNSVGFGELRYFGNNLNIGKGESFRFNEQIIEPQETLTGSIDEFRYYHRGLNRKEILDNKNRIVNGDTDLVLYYKFNEPYGDYTNNNVVLDSSFNSRNEFITNFILYNRLTGSDTPLTAEDKNRSPVLMPQFDKIKNLNTSMLVTASLYDDANPNLITRLIPRHYLAEGNDLEGYEINFGNIKDSVKNLKIAKESLSTPTSAQMMIKFLLTWAKYFDEIKLLVDSFSLYKTINYQEKNTIPDAFLKNLAKNFGISLPELFSSSNFDAFFNGYDYQGSDGKSSHSLFEIQNLVWRRILSDYPSYAATKGTLDNIKSIFRNTGIEPDNIFHVREYGGAKQKSLDSSMVAKKDEIGFLSFTGSIGNENRTVNYQGYPIDKSPYMISTYMSSSRLEAGTPLIKGAYVNKNNSNIHGTSNNISDGLFTSASFDYHATYYYPTRFDHPITQSLARLHVTGTAAPSTNESCIINLVSNLEENKLKLYINDSSTVNTTTKLELSDVDISNGDVWSINFGRTSSEFFDSNLTSKFYLRASTFEPGLEPIVYQTSSFISEPTDSVLSNVNTYNTSGSFLIVGSQSLESTSKFINSGNGDQIETKFSGFVTSINFWSRDYSDGEFIAYVKNPNNVGSTNPDINYNYLSQLSGSFQQVKMHTSGKQATTSSNVEGKIKLFDFSQRENHLQGYNFEASKKVITNKLIILEKLSDTFDLNSSNKKIRVRSIADKSLLAANEYATTTPVYEVDMSEEVFDDQRFSLDISVMKGLNENILDIFSDFQFLEDALGKTNLLFSEEYPNLVQVRKVYFNNLLEKINLNKYKQLFKWLDNAFTELVFSSLPRNTKFLGINFIYEQHMLERSKIRYLYDEIYLKSLPRNPDRGNIFLSQFVCNVKKG